MSPRSAFVLSLSLLLPLALQAQVPTDSARFVVLKGADTVAIESAQRFDVSWKGTLTLRRTPAIDMAWSAVLDEAGRAPLVEVTVSEAARDPREKPRMITRNRLIFREDSVAVDAMTSTGLVTRVFPTRVGAMPYLNLSFTMLELALRSAPAGASVEVPFLNLAGGQTAVARLERYDARHAKLTLGDVQFELATDGEGRLRAVSIPAQELMASRVY